MELTDLDREILDILCEDARKTAGDIAKMTGADEGDVSERIAVFENEGVIIKYRALLDREKIEHNDVEALIEVRITPLKDEGFDAIAKKISRYPEVKSVYLMSGGYDLMVRVEGSSLKSVAMFVSRRLSVIDGVLSTATHFLLKRYKSDGVILEKEQSDKRQAVTL